MSVKTFNVNLPYVGKQKSDFGLQGGEHST